MAYSTQMGDAPALQMIYFLVASHLKIAKPVTKGHVPAEKDAIGISIVKSLKLKKADYIKFLANSMTEAQWDMISKLRGLPTPTTQAQKENFLWGLFIKTRSRATAKGIARNLQKWLEGKIGELLNEPHGKDMEICSRAMNQTGPDVMMSPRICKLFPFTSECKSGNQWSLPYAIKQAQANLYENTDWMVVLDRPHLLKNERIPPIIVIDGEVFFRIIKEGIHGNRKIR